MINVRLHISVLVLIWWRPYLAVKASDPIGSSYASERKQKMD